MQLQLNTMDTILSGFKIIRNGQVFTLTPEEMSDFRYLDKALDGRDCLERYNANSEEEEKLVEEMKDDEELCHNIGYDISNIGYDISENVYNDSRVVEADVIKDYIKRSMRKFKNINDEDSSVWTLDDLKQLRKDEIENGLNNFDTFEEWLNNKLETDFEELS